MLPIQRPTLTSDDLYQLDAACYRTCLRFADSNEIREQAFHWSREKFRAKWPELTHYQNPDGYYFTIAKRHCFKLNKAAKRKQKQHAQYIKEVANFETSVLIEDSNVPDGFAQKVIADFKQDLNKLLERHTAGAFIYHMRQQGKSHKEIASLGHELLPNYGVKAHFNRCTQAMNKFLKALAELLREYFLKLGIHI